MLGIGWGIYLRGCQNFGNFRCQGFFLLWGFYIYYFRVIRFSNVTSIVELALKGLQSAGYLPDSGFRNLDISGMPKLESRLEAATFRYPSVLVFQILGAFRLK